MSLATLKTLFNIGGNGAGLPVEVGFARNTVYWKTLLVVFVNSIFISFMGLLYMNCINAIPRMWLNNWTPVKVGQYTDDFFAQNTDCPSFTEVYPALANLQNLQNNRTSCACDHCGFEQGEVYWIAVTTVGGFLLGLLRYAWDFPNMIKNLFLEIWDAEVNPLLGIQAYFLSALSLAVGADLGFERALGGVGGGITSYIVARPKLQEFIPDKNYRKLIVLSGFSAAFACVLPSPILAVMFVIENADLPTKREGIPFLTSIMIIGFASIISFIIYWPLIGEMWVPYTNAAGILITLQWNVSNLQTPFQLGNLGVGILIGFVAGVLGFIFFVNWVVFKALVTWFREAMVALKSKAAEKILPSVIAGFLIGVVNYCLPLTVASGTIQKIIYYGYFKALPINLLIACIFAKMFVCCASHHGGYMGGFMFPTLSIGAMSGVLTYKLFDGALPLSLCLCCFMAAVPGVIVPTPFTWCLLAIFLFSLGAYQTAPVFAAVIAARFVSTALFTLILNLDPIKALLPEVVVKETKAELSGVMGFASPTKPTQEDPKSASDRKSASIRKNELINGSHHGSGFGVAGGVRQSDVEIKSLSRIYSKGADGSNGESSK